MKFVSVFTVALLFFSSGHAFNEICTNQNMPYVKSSRFLTEKQDGSQYQCTCYARGCVRITCTRVRPPNEDSDPGRISGTVPTTTSRRPSVIQPSVSVPVFPSSLTTTEGPHGSRGTCYDVRNHRSYNRGEFFERNLPNRNILMCECPLTGSTEIVCSSTPKRCTVPQTPEPSLSNLRYGDGCFDGWNNREYRSGTRYTRERDMSDDGRITGQYSCTCDRGMTRCSAVDIPCCNVATGRWVDMNEKFITMHGGVLMNCECKRERGRYANCYSLGSRTGSSGSTPQYHPIARDGQCQDRTTGRRYSVNVQWHRQENNAEYLCTCNRLGSSGAYTYRTTCTFRRYLGFSQRGG